MPKSDKFKHPVAAIHTHFNIFRDVHDPKDGDVTIEEQMKALERFVRWHERQVDVGKKLLERLRTTASATT